MITHKIRNDSKTKKMIICVVLCLFAVCMLSTAAANVSKEKAIITIKVPSAEMVQGEDMPELKAKVSVTGDSKFVLDKKKGYKVQDLVKSLKKGENYNILCDADGEKEGKFPIKLELSDDIQDALVKDWLGKVKVEQEAGTFVVKNKYGEWEKDKFKKINGSYAKNEFIVSNGKTYYFGENEKKQTGWQKKDGMQYYFNKKGVMQTGWKEKDGTKVYLKEDGSMAVGWIQIKDDKYYFDRNGKALTGKHQVGTKKCRFAKDGKLKSEENSIDPNKPMLALTFDDGPGAGTVQILDVLKTYGARATFFMLGEKAEKYPETVKKMQEIGCELGNHTTTHKALTKLSPEEMKKELGTTSAAVSKATGGFATTLIRPPYGAVDEKVKANAGQPIIMWSVDTLDWKTRNVQNTIDVVLNSAKDGDIVLMHDIHKQSVEAAVKLIPLLVEKGYQLVTVSELAEMRGVSLENGVKYSQLYK